LGWLGGGCGIRTHDEVIRCVAGTSA
jgi:hypothetical protein